MFRSILTLVIALAGCVGGGTGADLGTATAASHKPPISFGSSNKSDLPGVSISLDSDKWSYTLAEAAAGITISIKVIMDNDVVGVLTQAPGACVEHQELAFAVETVITSHDGSRIYREHDPSKCPKDGSEKFVTIPAGVSRDKLKWSGRNWGGSGDEGEPFPPGMYIVRSVITGAKSNISSLDNLVPFKVEASCGFAIKE